MKIASENEPALYRQLQIYYLYGSLTLTSQVVISVMPSRDFTISRQRLLFNGQFQNKRQKETKSCKILECSSVDSRVVEYKKSLSDTLLYFAMFFMFRTRDV